MGTQECLFQTFKTLNVRSNSPAMTSTAKEKDEKTDFLLSLQEELGGKVACLEDELRSQKSCVVSMETHHRGSLKRDATNAFRNLQFPPPDHTQLYRAPARADMGISQPHFPISWQNRATGSMNYCKVGLESADLSAALRENVVRGGARERADRARGDTVRGDIVRGMRQKTSNLVEEQSIIYQDCPSVRCAPRLEEKSKARVTFATTEGGIANEEERKKTEQSSDKRGAKKVHWKLSVPIMCREVAVPSLVILLVINVIFVLYLLIQQTYVAEEPTKNAITEQPPQQDCTLTPSALFYSNVVSMMDPTVDPCEDFYQFACGGWMADNYFPEGRSEHGVIAMVAEKNDRALLELLARKGSANLTKAEKKAKAFYKSCMDAPTIDRLDAQPLYDLISSMGGWGALQTWNESGWDLDSMVYTCQGKLGVSVFFELNVAPNPFKPRQNALIIDTNGALSLVDETYYLDVASPTYEQQFKDAMRKMMSLLTTRNVDDVIDDVFRFEKELATALFRNSLSTDSVPLEQVSIRRLESICPEISWLKIFSKIFKTASITPDTQVVMRGPLRFFADLSSVLSESTARTLHNYVMWRIVFSRADRLSLRFRRVTSSFIYKMFNFESRKPRWSECLSHVKDQFGEALEVLFARDRSTMEGRKKVAGMAEKIKSSFRDYVMSRDWLDASARVELGQKLDAVRIRIGMGERYLEEPWRLDKLYPFLVDPKRFFQNFLLSVENKVRRTAETLAMKPDTSILLRPFTISGGFYVQEKQEVVIPVGFLQPPIFELAAPDASIFGSVGFVVGHELAHALDYGTNLSPEMRRIHNEKKDCVVTKFQRYTSNLEAGRFTLNENVADATGLKVAFAAFQRKGLPAAGRHFLPGLTDQQLFFISFAQSWCAKRERDVIVVGNHAPEKYRVLGSLSASKNFAETFSCKNGTAMNPRKRCDLW